MFTLHPFSKKLDTDDELVSLVYATVPDAAPKKSAEFWKNFIKSNKLALIVVLGYGAMFLSDIFFVAGTVRAFKWLDYRFLSTNPLYILLLAIFPPILFILSTDVDYFHFRKQKRRYFSVAYFTTGTILLRFLFMGTSFALLPKIFSITISPIMSEADVIWFGRIVCAVTYVMGALLLIWLYNTIRRNEFAMAAIYRFRLKHHVDLRSHVAYLYDNSIVQDMENGKPVSVFERDRNLATLLVGASGSGKTSMALLRTINDDLLKKCKNEDMQKQLILKMLRADKVVKIREFSEFHARHFRATPGNEKEFEKVLRTYRSAGMTIIAPNDDLLDSTYELCRKKGLRCNRIDACLTKEELHKEGFRGFNPLYIDPVIATTSFIQYEKAVSRRATIFRDVMNTINVMYGTSDSYFTNVSRAIAYYFTILAILVIPLKEGRQANLCDVQFLVNNCDKELAMSECIDLFDTLPPLYRENFSDVRSFVVDRFLSSLEMRNKNVREATGVINQINDLLNDSSVRGVFTCTDDATIDIDQCLARGEITVFNFLLDHGPATATAYGLFFLISFSEAVKRREPNPNKTIPHFFIVDELPQILDEGTIQASVDLFRQYNIATIYAMQSLSQMLRRKETEYLQTSLLKCGTHIVFGRASAHDMKVYAELAGMCQKETVQYSTTETSMLSAEPQLSESVRTVFQKDNFISETDIRYRDFQEITFFGTRNGSPLLPMHGKLRFLTDKEWQPIKRLQVDFSPFPVVEVTEAPPEPPTTTVVAEVTVDSDIHSQQLTMPDTRTNLDYNTVPRIATSWNYTTYTPIHKFPLLLEIEEKKKRLQTRENSNNNDKNDKNDNNDNNTTADGGLSSKELESLFH